jgi:hypothetical protein
MDSHNDYEAAALHFLPYGPVQKKKTDHPGKKRDHADISNTTGKEVELSAFGAKKGIGKTGFHLQYNNSNNYKQLLKEKKDKLCEWRRRTGQGKGKGNKPDTKKKSRYDKEKAIASAVTKQVGEKMKAVKEAKNNGDKAEAYIMSIFKKYAGKASVSDVTPAAAPPVLLEKHS